MTGCNVWLWMKLTWIPMLHSRYYFMTLLKQNWKVLSFHSLVYTFKMIIGNCKLLEAVTRWWNTSFLIHATWNGDGLNYETKISMQTYLEATGMLQEWKISKMKQNRPLQISDFVNLCISRCIRTKEIW